MALNQPQSVWVPLFLPIPRRAPQSAPLCIAKRVALNPSLAAHREGNWLRLERWNPKSGTYQPAICLQLWVAIGIGLSVSLSVPTGSIWQQAAVIRRSSFGTPRLTRNYAPFAGMRVGSVDWLSAQME